MRSNEPMGLKVLMIDDVSRAFFEVPATRHIWVEIPKEDITEADVRHDNGGHLRLSLYSTWDACTNCQDEVANQTRTWGFRRGKYNNCLCFMTSGT